MSVGNRWGIGACGLAAVALAAALPMAVCSRVAADEGQKVFPTPMAASDALFQTIKADDMNAALTILGPQAKPLVTSGDPVADRDGREFLTKKFDQMHRLAYTDKGSVLLYIGSDNWPFPIPIVKKNNGWVFDTAEGEKEILYRRIGKNELFTIATLRQLVAAQNEYRKDAGNSNQFAQHILSSPNTHDGLYWPVSAGQSPSPIGALVANAAAEGYKASTAANPAPFHAYIYRVLTGQGKDAPGGAKSYLVDGKLTGGFAFLAYPVDYRSSGVMTFMVNQDGTIFQKDLGPETAKAASAIEQYNPDKTWAPVAEYSN